MVTVIEVGIIVTKILARNAVFIRLTVVIEVFVTNVHKIGLTRADTDVIVMADIAFALLLALDFVDVSFEVVGSKLIAILAGAAMDRFMAGFGVEALVVASSNNCTAANTAPKFSMPTPSWVFSSSAALPLHTSTPSDHL